MSLVRLTEEEVHALRRDVPELPEDYLRYLQTTGWGEAESGFMVYSGPMDVDEVDGGDMDLPNVVLLADDFQGDYIGFDRETRLFGEISEDGEWEPCEKGTRFADLVAE